MLKRLRWQLTALYFLAALCLVILIGWGSYALLSYYFQRTTDLALQYKMATLFRSYGAVLPAELAQAEQTWLAEYGRPLPTPLSGRSGQIVDASRGEGDHPDLENEREETHEHPEWDEEYDASLAPIFEIPLDSPGGANSSLATLSVPVAADMNALGAAEQQGSDWRTINLDNGTPVRLLTYSTGSTEGPELIQIGRLMSDQSRVLNLYMTGLVLLGAVASFGLGVGGWWVSGRSIRPAQRAWDQQQAFISNASHELRTPLTLIRANADYGLRNEPSAESAKLLQDIITECDYMDSLVDDLLLLSRLDTHRFQFKRERIAISELLTETIRQVERLAREKPVRLEIKSAEGIIWGDPTRMRQVLLIFLDNALRFTPPGGEITLESEIQGKNVQISVKDTGEGIPPQHLPHVFERFYQVNPSTGSEIRSNGLGLSIAKSLVEVQGGHLNLRSELGVGTEVIIIFPQSAAR